MEIGIVKQIDIDKEMQQAYLDYAMSVIVSRALPDARDGLKPVHRRILYSMYDMGLRPGTGYKKSARVVGEVLGKYHPHSDAAVYDAMARMAQDFSMRYPLVDGQGNFGSVDGDPPAAMRYTEAKMALPSMDMLADIQKDTVDFIPNFDESLKEPKVLPAALPNLLINGATGIAVGMSTSIPPHNLTEIVDACIYMLKNWSSLDKVSVEDLMEFVKGPDFPTGGVLVREAEEDNIAIAYGRGRGRVSVWAVADIEETGGGKQRIIVTELPYMTNKSALIERIAALSREGKLDGITDLRDESDRQGMRIVIELARGVDGDKVLEELYKRTNMRSTFSMILLALVNGEPTLLTLKQALKVYLDHRLEVVRRRSEHDLARYKQRAHILEGLRIALQNLDEIIDIIRKSKTVENARENLQKRFKLSEIQAQAILDMPLRRLAALERKKIELEYLEVLKNIKALESLLKSPAKMREVVAVELEKVKEEFGDRRRTRIVLLNPDEKKPKVITARDMLPDHNTWVSIMEDGRLSRTHDDKQPRLWGSSAVYFTLEAGTRDTLYLVADDGQAAAVAVHSLPETDDPEEGVHYSKISPLTTKDVLATMFSLPPRDLIEEGWNVLTCTRGGMLKKSALEELPGPTAQKFQMAKVKEGDLLAWAELTNGNQDILMVTASGMAIRFSEDEVRPMGLIATGVNGIKLKVGDEVVGLEVLDEKYNIFILADDSRGKMMRLDQFPIQGRYGQGVTAWKLDQGIRIVGTAHGKDNKQIGVQRIRRTPKLIRLDSAPIRTRAANGLIVFENKSDAEQILSITVPKDMQKDILKKK
ncbi:MAG: DNA topoisomerase 4 subunit A [Anaerolineales bacterium]|nr:DNA topoisomerase 4 subunit A [Anaerolineales bacterium]